MPQTDPARERHAFAIDLVGVGTPRAECLRGLIIFRNQASVVVVDFVIIGSHDKRDAACAFCK